MTHITFYPNKAGDSSPTSVDGYMQEDSSGEGGQAWAALRAEDPGSAAYPSNNSFRCKIKSFADNWNEFQRGIVGFDKSAIDGDNIDSATFDAVCILIAGNDFSDGVSLVDATPASNTDLTTADYDHTGTTQQAADVAISGITADSATFTLWTLNATGLTRVSGNGVINFGIRSGFDRADAEPSRVNGSQTNIRFASAEEALSSDKRPRLVITHSSPFTPKAIMF